MLNTLLVIHGGVQRDFDAFFAVARDILAQDPKSFYVRFQVGKAHQKLEDWDAARRAFLEMEELLPGHQQLEQVFFELGVCHMKSGDRGAALSRFRMVKDPGLRQALGVDALERECRLKMPVPSLGGFGKAMRAGHNLAPDACFGRRTFDEWLKVRYATR